jgi:hypothetical protein
MPFEVVHFLQALEGLWALGQELGKLTRVVTTIMIAACCLLLAEVLRGQEAASLEPTTCNL